MTEVLDQGGKSSSSETETSGYRYSSANPSHTHSYLMPIVRKLINPFPTSSRLFELGCGSGATANELAQLGYQVTAVDPSTDGIKLAKEHFHNCKFALGSAYDDLSGQYGLFDLVISLEVVEHVFYPRKYAETVANLLAPGGTAIISTPYHGYLKNLALALGNKWDRHADPLWDYGHIKFWTRSSLVQLFEEAGLQQTSFHRVGRIPQLAKSMILGFRKM